MTVADMLNSISACGFASPSWASGKLGIVYDARGQSPVMTFGMANILKDSFSIDYVSENLAEEIVVRYRNPDRNYQQDEVRTIVPGVETPTRISSIDLYGCTNKDMAGKFANYLAAQQYYRRRYVSWESDFEGFVCQRGDVVLLSHDLTQWGYSGRFVSVDNQVVTLDRSVPRRDQVEYLMLIRPDGTTTTYQVAPSSEDQSDTLTVINDAIELQPGQALINHRWCFSPLETPGKKLKIMSIDPQSASRVRITATDENPEFYDAWDGTFIAPDIETVLPSQSTEVFNVDISRRPALENGYVKNRISVRWQVSGVVQYSRVQVFLNGQVIQEYPRVELPFVQFDVEQSGLLTVKITPYSAQGAGFTVTTTKTIQKLDLPVAPDGVTMTVAENETTATFSWPEVPGVQSYFIEIFAGGAAVRGINVGNALAYTYTLDDAVNDGGPFRNYEFRVFSVATKADR